MVYRSLLALFFCLVLHVVCVSSTTSKENLDDAQYPFLQWRVVDSNEPKGQAEPMELQKRWANQVRFGKRASWANSVRFG